MTFGSLPFLFVFLPAALAAFYLASRRMPAVAVALLPIVSALYCYLTDLRTLVLLGGSIAGNFLLLNLIRRSRAIPWMPGALTAGGVVANLLPLVHYKLEHAASLGIMSQVGQGGVALQPIPLGLAFFTLQQITFLVDAQRDDVPNLGFGRYCAWASLFCQLPAGPIAPYGKMVPQFARLGAARPSVHDLALGLSLFIFGLQKKLLLADFIGFTIDPLYRAAEIGPIHVYEGAAAIWGFMMQLYFNFSAYSDMAIGLGMCLGLRLPPNFDSPLQAKSVGGYIMRWHMSLMHFIRDYVFISLFRRLSGLRRHITPMGVWAAATVGSYVAMGAWHSLSGIFLAFSAFAGLVVVLAQLVHSLRKSRRGETSQPWARRTMAILGQLSVLIIASTTAMLLRAESLDGVRNILVSLGNFGDRLPAAVSLPKLIMVMTAASLVALACPNTMRLFGIIDTGPATDAPWWKWRPSPYWGWAVGACGVIVLLLLTRDNSYQDFLYARF